MLFLIALVVSVVFVWFLAKPMKKYPVPFYIGGSVITTALIIMNLNHVRDIPPFLSQWVIPIFTKGILAAALWIIVAWTGALPNGSKPIKHIMPVRGELSIFAAIITLSHAVTYGISYLQRLSSGSTTSDFMLSFIICLVLMIIMIPLTIMSFKTIRKKMNGKTWKNIQRFAYLFYALIYIHILVIYMQKPSSAENIFNLVVYSAVFFGYAVSRIRKYLIVKKKTEKIIAVNMLYVVALALTAISPAVLRKTTPTKAPQTKTAVVISADVPAVTAEKQYENVIISVTTAKPAKAESDSETTTQTESSEEVAATTTVTASADDETEVENAIAEENNEDDTITEDEEVPEQVQQDNYAEENPVRNEPATESVTEPVSVYQNGTFSASAYGYDGDVSVTITIENDYITEIRATTSESDEWYFDSAYATVCSQILNTQSTNVDAVSGATYSSNAIMSAVQKALDSARN